MTLPDERYRAVAKARDFLRRLLDPKQTPKVPRAARREAYAVLRHFPSDCDMIATARKAKGIWNDDQDR